MISIHVRSWPQHSFSDYGKVLILVIRVRPLFQMVSFHVRLGIAFGTQWLWLSALFEWFGLCYSKISCKPLTKCKKQGFLVAERQKLDTWGTRALLEQSPECK